MFILINKYNIITCVASARASLHQSKIDAGDQVVELDPAATPAAYSCLCGDRYDPVTLQIEIIPENHPQPTTEELAEIQIQAEIRRLAVASLKAKGALDDSFVDSKDVAEEAVTIEASEVSK